MAQFNTLKINVLTASMLVAALSLTGCGSDNDDTKIIIPDAVEQQQTISGIITDANGKPLDGAVVTIGNQSITTSNTGAYSTKLTAPKSKTVVLVKKSGHLTTAREIIVLPKQSYKLNIALTPDQVTTAFASSAGVNELAVSGAKVSIPANTIVNADGSNYTGTVNIAANYYNPDSLAGARSFAQPFAGQDEDGSDRTDLVTVGVIDVKLTDPSTGAELDLKEGTIATLIYPEVSTDQDLPSIPLWYYDEAQTIWVKDGNAVRQADGSYRGEVSHFTLWNLDIPLNEYYALLEGCIIDATTKQPYTKGDFIGQIKGRGFFNLGGADSEGKFSIKVPFNTPLFLSPSSYSVKFDKIVIPALAQNATYKINGGNCIEISAANNSNNIDLNGNNFDELPLAPVPIPPITPSIPSVPESPFQPPITNNTGLIGYGFEFDLNNDDKLENVVLITLDKLAINFAFYLESLYRVGDYQESIDFLNKVSLSSILTRQGVSQESAPYTLDGNRVKSEMLGTTTRGNQLIQQLDNGFRSVLTFNDRSISGLKIGDVLSYNSDENEFPQDIIDDLNNLPFSKGMFTGAAGCKRIRSINNNEDFITFSGLGYNSNFDNEVRLLDLNPVRGTWAGIPWAAKRVADEDEEFETLIDYNDLVYEGSYSKGGFVNLSTAETIECAYYNEAAKTQILEAIKTAYPTL